MTSRKLPELLTGLAVVLVAAAFLVYALGRTGAITAGGYPLQAQFSSIGGLTVGADVKIGGVTVGHVADEHLDPNTYAAILRLVIDRDIKIPDDSSAAISSDGLLGGNYVAISPGGSDTMLAPGASFPVTQSAVNIEDLLGKFIFSMGGASPAKPANPAPTGGQGSGGIGNPAALPNPQAP